MSTGATVESQAPDGSQLSPQQRRLWSLQQDGTIHLAGCAIALDGPVQRDLVKAALHILTQRYEILRTSFHCPAGMTLPLQLIRPSSERHHNAAFFWSEDYVEKLDLDMFLARTAFDLETGPFFHAHLTRRSDNDHLLFLAMPALYADDTALALLAREVATLYQVLAFGGSSHADETGDDTPLPYVDVAEWLNDILQSEASESAKLFWQQTAFETGLHLRIPFKHTAVNDTAFRAVTLVRTLAIDHVARLRQMAQTHRITVSAIVLSCWQVLLARLSGQTDVTVAVGYGGRNYEELEDIPGLFTRYLPIAARIEDTLRFDALLQHTRDDLEEADQKQEYYEWEEGPTAGGLYFPFAFDYNTPSNSPYQAGPVTLSMVQTCADTDRFGIRLSCSASERELVLSFRNNTAQFPAEHVGILAEQFLALLDQALAQPDRSVYDLDFLNDIEQQRLLVDFNHLHNEHLNDEVLSETIRCFHHRFEAQVVCTPEAIAAISGSHHLSYRVLNARANILAHHLRQRGVGAEISVGVYLDRSVELLIGLLGILKAGAAYVPLDLTWPLPRLAYVLRDSGMPLVLTRTSLAATLPEDSPPSLCLDDLSWEASPHAALNPSHTVLATNLAYVMYTSGSTGQTKGVRIEHRALTNYLDWALGSYHVTRGRGAPVHASIGFDATITALFLPLLAGQTVHLLPERNEAGDEVEALAAMFATQSGFSLVKLTPAHMDLLQMLLSPDDVAGKANALVIGGEALLEKHLSWWREHAPGMRLINEYGPTETVVGCCFYDVPTDASYQGAIPIGFPLARTQIYILNAQMRPVPRGVAGELHIGGAGLGRDYLHQSALTAEKFVPHPFASEPGARLYRSGDLARHLPNGSAEPGPLEFLGRVDHQVQLRGFRIELGEIEAVLSTHTEVAEQVVLLHQDATGEPRLVAYVQTIQRDPQPHDALRHFLADRLPAYMVPTAFVFVDAFALTPNGKVDRRALPSPDLHGETATYVEPRTQTEKLLADLWNRLLGVDRIGIHDDFFRMGGHSLLATRMISQVRDLFEVELPLLTVFETPRLAGLSAEIEAATSGATHVLPPVQPIAHDDAERNRLSFAQQRLWFLNQLEGPSPTYNIPGAFRLKGHLEIAAVEQALIHIVARHEILRTRFAEEHGQPWAVIDAAAVSPVRLVSLDDLSGESLPGEPLETRIAHYCIHEARQPFDLAQGPLFRAVLLRVAPDDHILLLTMHHIISDGWSINILIREFSALYASYVTNRPAQLPQLPVQYADYVYWQRHQLNEVSLRSQLDYWLHQLDDAPPFLQLPTDRPRPATVNYRGQSLTFQVDEDLTQRLRALCRETGVTLFMALLSAYALLLSRYSGQQDLVVGSVTANRNRPEVESLIGFFVNTLALRADLSGNPTVADLLARLRRTCLEAFAHQDVPFKQLVSELHPERNPGYAPIFQAAFQLLNEPTAELEMPGVSLSMIDRELMVSKYDLILSLEETGQTLSGMFEYNIDLFETTTIERMTGHLQRLLEGFVEGSSQTIDALSLLSEAERHQLLAEWNDTRTEYPQAQCLHQLFEAQAVQRPEATAVVFEEAHLTYQALNQRANQLANYLLGLGVGPETLVGVCLERSFELVACLLGILKAGGAYVPLDPSYPEARLAYMLADASPLVVITSQGLVERWPSEVNVLVVDTAQTMARLAQASQANPKDTDRLGELSPEHPAYVIYTSGSTGQPKGVVVSHVGIGSLRMAQVKRLQITSEARILQYASLSFDASLWELVMALTSGAALILLREEERSGSVLQEVLIKQRVSHATLPPVVLETLRPSLDLCLDGLVVAGESSSGALVQAWCSSVRLINAYGPTESTVCATMSDSLSGASSPPIGFPIDNTQVYVLDASLEPLPVGVLGELYISGVGLARGYLNRFGLTSERFVANPYGSPGSRMYRTGDLARWRSDGTLEFMGRADEQVKLRGYRIELSEIESVLVQHESVSQAAVVLRDEGPGSAELVVYVMPSASGEVEVSVLQGILFQQLPSYMVPSAIVTLEALPLTPNGKLDRRALPAPQRQSEMFRGPRTPQEEVFCEVFAEVLGVNRVGVDEDFFVLGGHSLLATRVVSRLRSVLGVEVAVRTLFEASTVEQLAVQLSGVEAVRPALVAQARGSRLPLSPAQFRLWFIHTMEGPSATYNIPLALRLEGTLNLEALGQALGDVVGRHESLRTVFGEEEGEPYQQVLPLSAVEVPLSVERVSESALAERVSQAAASRFDLSGEVPLRMWVFELSPKSHALVLLLHHIASDGWSLGPLFGDLSMAYRARLEGRAPSYEPLPVQYGDYTLWQRQVLGEASDLGSVLSQQLAYWFETLSGLPEEIALPRDWPRPLMANYEGEVIPFELSGELHAGIRRLAQSSGSTLFMVLQAALAALLSRLGAGDDIAIGTPIAGRGESGLEGLVGFFVNTLVLRTDVSGDPSFEGLLHRVRERALEAYSHAEVPFERVVEALHPERSLSRHPVFQVMIEMATAGTLSESLRDRVERLPFRAKIKLFDDGRIAPASASGLETWSGPGDGFAWPEVGPDDAAVIGFTSGPTGIPKGIVGRHGPLTHFMPWMIEEFGLDHDDRHSMLSGIAHDPIQRDIFTPLFMDAVICIPDAADIGPIQLSRWMKQAGISVTMVTPSMADIITQTPEDIVLDRLRCVFLVGERLTARLVTDLRGLAPQTTVVNLFGCTESQRAVSYHMIPGGNESTFEPDSPNDVLPLGRGMVDVQLLVLNQSMQLAGVGEIGDIYIRSPHLARGYLNDEQQTRAAFLINPFTGQVDDRAYKTGDLGRYLPDGNVAYVERSDFQVKIRGFRIEIPEIELTLMQHSQVQHAVVLAHENEQCREKQLVGYVRPMSPSSAADFDAGRLQSELYHYLSERLPAFMVPATFVFVNTIPLTPNNKTDRKALAALPIEHLLPQRHPTDDQTPTNAMEAKLVDIWSDVLDAPALGVTDDFFELGGHSLRAVQVVSRIREHFAVELPLRALFEDSTIRELALYIESSDASAQEPMALLQPVSRDREFPLSFSQQRLWVLHRLENLGAAYNIPAAVQIQGTLDVNILQRALNEIVRRHEALRTNFVANDDGQPIQVLHADGDCPMTLVSLRSISSEGREAEIRQRATEAAELIFDLETDRLIRATVLHVDDTIHVLLLTMNHIVSDGWSMGILIDELTALYQAFSENRPSPLPELPIQYADYAFHQQEQFDDETLQQQLAYWQAQCEGAPALLELATDRPRPPLQSYRGGAVHFKLGADLTSGLNPLARDTDTTLFMTLLSGFAALLSRYSGQNNFLLGTPVANRQQHQIEPLIGFFVNTLALRMDLDGDPSVRDLLARIRRTCLDGFARQDTPFERLIQVLRPERAPSYAPLFQAMFVLQNTPVSDATLPGLTFSVVEREQTTTKFDLTLTMIEMKGGLEGRWEYNADIFDLVTIERQVGHFQRLLQGMVADSHCRVSALPLIHEAEYRMLIHAPHQPVTEASDATRVTELIESWGVQTSDAIAVAFEHELLTYHELNRRANRFAHLLRQVGVGPNVLVGLCVERSLEMAVGLLAILKAGGAYVPLDPAYPAERLAFMLADSGISVILTQHRFEPELRTAGTRLIALDGDLPHAPDRPPTMSGSPHDLAYVIYTSGSTGQPKGVQISHRSLMVSNQARFDAYGEAPDAFLLLSSVSFDSSVVGIFWTLTGGGTLCIPSQEALYSTQALTDIIWQYHVSHLLCLPSLYDAILEDAEPLSLGSLQSVIVAGEACPIRLIDIHRERLAETALFNEYGPTEATVWSSVYDCRVHRPGARVSIGTPIPGSRSYVLDAQLQTVPMGVSGELCIGGESLAQGYLQRPALTAERFLPDPYGDTPGARMYRTGDLARYCLHYDICILEFLGRVDDQVKIRGFRVEPGEIEALLNHYDGVREAVVVVREDGNDNTKLVGYIQAVDGHESSLDTVALRAFLAASLPDYMIPASFMFLDALPQTPNGKLDRRALPAPEETGDETQYEAPATPTEEQLAELWAALLKLERVSVRDHFFDSGGHSLLATRLISHIRRRLGVEISLADLFREPTLRGIAEHIDNRLWVSRGQKANNDISTIDDDQEELVL